MKINTTKLVVGVLAVAGVASLVGSISGTVAWFQYNTRTVAEFGGTTTKCSEYLEMRTVTDATADLVAKEKAATLPEFNADSYPDGAKVIVDDGGKVYTSDGTKWDGGAEVAKGTKYKVGDIIYKLGDSGWTEIEKEYGEWINYLDKKAMAELTGNAGNYKPVTAPGAESGKALPTLKANPICGYTDYDKWNDADADDYMQFTLQFRVLDLDGSTTTDDNDREMLGTKLYITDLTLQNANGTSSSKKDVTSALRFHIADSDATKNQLFGWGDDETVDGAAATFKTDTHGQLNLGGVDRVANDIGLDVRNNYSFSEGDLYSPLNYGVIPAESPASPITDSVQTVKNLNFGSTYIPTDDGKGNLSGGEEIGTTVAHAMGDEDGPLEDDEYLTFTFTTWLEGWHELGDNAITGSKTAVTYIGLAPETAANGATWFNTKDNKVYTYSTSTNKWGEAENASTTAYYTTDDGKTAMQYVDGAWKNVNNRIWNDIDYVGSTFNIGISFGVNALQ